MLAGLGHDTNAGKWVAVRASSETAGIARLEGEAGEGKLVLTGSSGGVAFSE